MSRRSWTKYELECAREMRAAGYFYGKIDRVLGCRAGSTKRRLEGHTVEHTFLWYRIPKDLSAERDAVAAAREQRALTQCFFGNPPPGYSALYGKTGLR